MSKLSDYIVSVEPESSARSDADSTLQNAIDSEATTRSNSDSTLTSAINQEVTARSNADSTLQSTIDSLSTTTWVYSSTAAENRNATAPCQVMACVTSTPITITLPPTDVSSTGKKVRILDDELLQTMREVEKLPEEVIWDKDKGELISFFFTSLSNLQGIKTSTDGAERTNLINIARFTYGEVLRHGYLDKLKPILDKEQMDSIQFIENNFFQKNSP